MFVFILSAILSHFEVLWNCTSIKRVERAFFLWIFKCWFAYTTPLEYAKTGSDQECYVITYNLYILNSISYGIMMIYCTKKCVFFSSIWYIWIIYKQVSHCSLLPSLNWWFMRTIMHTFKTNITADLFSSVAV